MKYHISATVNVLDERSLKEEVLKKWEKDTLFDIDVVPEDAKLTYEMRKTERMHVDLYTKDRIDTDQFLRCLEIFGPNTIDYVVKDTTTGTVLEEDTLRRIIHRDVWALNDYGNSAVVFHGKRKVSFEGPANKHVEWGLFSPDNDVRRFGKY